MLAVFVALAEYELKAQADAQEGPVAAHGSSDGLDQPAVVQCLDAVAEGADSGQDQFAGSVHVLGAWRNPGFVPDAFECFLHAAQIAHAVVNDRNQARWTSRKRVLRRASSAANGECNWRPP